jgi:hypothetical protein
MALIKATDWIAGRVKPPEPKSTPVADDPRLDAMAKELESLPNMPTQDGFVFLAGPSRSLRRR